MFGGVVGDAERGIEDECLRVEVADGRLMGQVVVSAGGIKAYLQLDVAAGQAPVQDLADVYADLRHYSKNMQRTVPNILLLCPFIIFHLNFGRF